MNQGFLIPMNQGFLRPMNQRFLRPMNQRFLIKGGPKAPKCKDVCYPRYPEMSGTLSYRLRTIPLVKGLRPSINQMFGKSLFFVFIKRFLQLINKNILEFLFLFEHSFFYLLFFKNRRQFKKHWNELFDNKRFCNPTTRVLIPY